MSDMIRRNNVTCTAERVAMRPEHGISCSIQKVYPAWRGAASGGDVFFHRCDERSPACGLPLQLPANLRSLGDPHDDPPSTPDDGPFSAHGGARRLPGGCEG